jgi:hypothetical protein
MIAMRSVTYREESTAPFLRSMVLVALGSFAVGFGGYLVFGLNLL